jgi:hypothetical protein
MTCYGLLWLVGARLASPGLSRSDCLARIVLDYIKKVKGQESVQSARAERGHRRGKGVSPARHCEPRKA